MSFKIYFNKKTRHPSISLSDRDKKIWKNLEMTHNPAGKNNYIEIECVSRNGNISKSHIRKYIRKDKPSLKSKYPKKIKLTNDSEIKVKNYLRKKHKKR